MKRKNYPILKTEFAKELIKLIPSNLYCANALKVPVSSVANKRATIKDAVKGGHYFLNDKNKAKFKPILALLRKKHGLTKNGDKNKVKVVETVSTNDSKMSVLVTLVVGTTERIITINDKDRLEIIDNQLYRSELLLL